MKYISLCYDKAYESPVEKHHQTENEVTNITKNINSCVVLKLVLFITMESMIIFFLLLTDLCSPNVIKCIKLFAITWVSIALFTLLVWVSSQIWLIKHHCLIAAEWCVCTGSCHDIAAQGIGHIASRAEP